MVCRFYLGVDVLKKFHVTLLATVLLFVMLFNVVCVYGESVLRFYAEVVKYPTLAYPEPVLAGGVLEVRLALSEDASPSDFSLTMFSEFGSYELSFESVSYSSKWKSWVAEFKVSEDVTEGLYSMKITFTAAGKHYVIEMPHCIWVLKEWPSKIRLIYTADTKTPAGTPYWREMAYVANILNATMLIFNGDEVERPTQASAWKYFLLYWLQLNKPSYAGIGNHEYDSPGVAETWERIMGYRNFTVTVGNFLFLFLDTGMDGWVPLEQIKWVENVLKNNPDKVKILTMHHPIFGYKIRDEKIATIEITSIEEDFEKLFNEGYFYESWKNHKEELKELFKAILENGVHLVLTGHTHNDINNVVIYNGQKYFFITATGVPYDVRMGDWRGFRLIDIYANGTIDEKTLTYLGKPFNDYPNSIPIDVGEGIMPYEIGLLEYYYTPANDGSSHTVSLKIKNKLDENYNLVVAFRVPNDIPFENYKIIPENVTYTVTNTDKGYYYVLLKNITIKPRSELKFTITSEDDKEEPEILSASISKPSEIKFATLAIKVSGWWIGEVEATDKGWGVASVKVMYNTGNGWKEPELYDLDLDKTGNGIVAYRFWINEKELAGEAQFKIVVTDFSGKTVEKTYMFTPEKGLFIPETTTVTTTSPTETVTTPTETTTTPTETITPTETTPTETITETPITTPTTTPTTTYIPYKPKGVDYTPLYAGLFIAIIIAGILIGLAKKRS